MTKKGVLIAIFSIFLALFFAVNSYASFACGSVVAANGIESSWANVKVSYLDNPAKSTICKVSPENSKYCCDILNINGASWAVGKNVSASIYLMNGLYFSKSANITISGNGYDVMPDLELKESIKLNSPIESVFNSTKIEFNLSLEYPYTNLSYILDGNITNRYNVCYDCGGGEFSIDNLTYGEHHIDLIASNGSGEVSIAKDFSVIKNITISRKVECSGCAGNKIPSGSIVNITIRIYLSENASGKITDYFPSDWQYFGENESGPYSSTHNFISWNVKGRELSVSYSLTAPTNLISKKYSFQSEFEGFDSSVSKYTLSRFWPFDIIAIPEGFVIKPNKKYYYSKFIEVTPESPLILNLNETEITNILIYPNLTLNESSAFVEKYSPFKLSGSSSYLTLLSSINDIRDIEIYAKAKKTQISKKDLKIYEYDTRTGNWSSLGSEIYYEDSNFSYFKFYSKEQGAFSVKYEKRR